MLRTGLLAAALPLFALAMATTAAEEAPAERVAVGDEAPGFTLPEVDGTEHTLAELRGEKRAVLVFFRGAW